MNIFQLFNGTKSNSGVVHKICGPVKESIFKSNENIMTINFHSDDRITGKGFIIKIREIKGRDG